MLIHKGRNFRCLSMQCLVGRTEMVTVEGLKELTQPGKGSNRGVIGAGRIQTRAVLFDVEEMALRGQFFQEIRRHIHDTQMSGVSLVGAETINIRPVDNMSGQLCGALETPSITTLAPKLCPRWTIF